MCILLNGVRKKAGRIMLREIGVNVEPNCLWQIQKGKVTAKNTNGEF